MELFFADDIQESRVRLGPEESAHCVRVLRHRPGDEISVIDGVGTLYRCALEIADAKGAEARILDRTPGFGAHPYHLTMAVCPTKNIDRYEWFVEKATEVGVDVIAPVIGERSERRVLKTDRLRRLALSAAKQSLKAAIPQIAEPQSVRDFILSAPADALKLICYCFDDVERRPITDILCGQAGTAVGRLDFERSEGRISGPDEMSARLQKEVVATESADEVGNAPFIGGSAKRWGFENRVDQNCIAILIGPEGDFSPEEAALAREHGWIPVSLGESRLRTETAAVVAATSVYLYAGI
jgi:16S rRNA (uracil1498-N3)-methyltransferase